MESLVLKNTYQQLVNAQQQRLQQIQQQQQQLHEEQLQKQQQQQQQLQQKQLHAQNVPTIKTATRMFVHDLYIHYPCTQFA